MVIFCAAALVLLFLLFMGLRRRRRREWRRHLDLAIDQHDHVERGRGLVELPEFDGHRQLSRGRRRGRNASWPNDAQLAHEARAGEYDDDAKSFSRVRAFAFSMPRGTYTTTLHGS